MASGLSFLLTCLIQDLTLSVKKFKQFVKQFINVEGGNQYGKGQAL